MRSHPLTHTLRNHIAQVLREEGNLACITQADRLESESIPLHALALRSLDLSPSSIRAIADCLKASGQAEADSLRSLSLSYNSAMGEEAVAALMVVLPLSLTELGLVQCNLSDTSGSAIRDYLHRSSKLQMVCVEGNDFSTELKTTLREWQASRPGIILVL